ncbi:hypothetical protein N8I77_010950 [Diaporthe amygdali]|uniref:Uncharacterized protein n=1 Tax=Phomopsis amygdali TaxID=1214568 RepID=A0AAD9S9D5_PHOAM|nr:hypothetical protein N8I77_010950 [Diaporthe amygdali]
MDNMKTSPEFEPMLGKDREELPFPMESKSSSKLKSIRPFLIRSLCFLTGALVSCTLLWALNGADFSKHQAHPHETHPAAHVDLDSSASYSDDHYKPTHRCGQTADEARANNCILNLANYAWVPRDCYDAELVEETITGWEWFRDYDMTDLVPHPEVLRGELELFYQPFDQHEKHCVYIWKRLYRATLSGKGSKKLEVSGAASYPHVEHCGRVLLRDNSTGHLSVTVAKGQIIFPKC